MAVNQVYYVDVNQLGPSVQQNQDDAAVDVFRQILQKNSAKQQQTHSEQNKSAQDRASKFESLFKNLVSGGAGAEGKKAAGLVADNPMFNMASGNAKEDFVDI